MQHSKKKIALIDFDMSVTGGVEFVTSSLAKALSDEFDVYVIGIYEKNGSPVYDLSGIKEYISLGCKSERLRAAMREIRKILRRVLREREINIALLMGNYAAFVSIPAMIFSKTKFIYCDHGALINQIHEKAITLIRFLNCFFATKLVVLTEKTKYDYKKYFHVRDSKICVMPNWIDEKVISEAGEYDLDSEKILSVGRFGPEKGYDLLVQVAELVLPKHPDWQWHVFGEGETFEEIKRLVEEKNLENQLILMGNRADVLALYRNYAMLVLPSYREGLPLVLLEAKANHLPLVSFDIDTGPREIIEDRENGYLVKPYDIQEMSFKIDELIANRELRRDFSEKSDKNIQKFSKKDILEKWVNYLNIL